MLQGTHRDDFSSCFFLDGGDLCRIEQVTLVEDDKIGDVAAFEGIHPRLVKVLRLLVDDNECQVGLGNGLLGALVAQCPQLARVVISCRVGEQAGTKRIDFHGLVHRVGGGAGRVARDGYLLPRDGVDEA